MDLNLIQNELSEIKQQIEIITKALKNFTYGSLKISKVGDRIYYCQIVGKGKERKFVYIRKDNNELIKNLAQKMYLKDLLKTMKTREKALTLFCKFYSQTDLANIYDRLSNVRKNLVKPFILSTKQYSDAWAKEKFNTNSFYPENKKYVTKRGDLVRSKSEVMIADILFGFHIPYRYEAEIKIENDCVFYPDFTILNIRTRKEIYLEHFGLMDDEHYLFNALKKIEMYSRAGLILGDNLILSFESSNYPFNRQVVETLIKKNCL